MTQKEFVRWVYPAAKGGEIDPVFVTAQAALETGWGKSAIGNNLFGITKGSSWTGKTQLVTTTEYFGTAGKQFKEPEKVLKIESVGKGRYKYTVKRLFRDYDSVSDCIKDHFAILSKKIYADAWPYRHDAVEYTRRIVDSIGAKYATDPDYVRKMESIIKSVQRIVKSEKL